MILANCSTASRNLATVSLSLISLGMICPRHNTVDCPTLFWAAIPGNEGDFPSEESFHTFIEQSVCLFTEETNYMDSPSPFGIKMADRISGKPLHIDISDLPMRKGVTTNRNKFVLGPSGSGKSFFMNHLVRQYYEQGTHVVSYARTIDFQIFQETPCIHLGSMNLK